MNNFSKTLAASSLLVLSIGLVGCQTTPGVVDNGEAPEISLQKATKKLSEVTSYNYDLSLKGDLTGAEGVTPQQVSFDFNLDGGIDAKDPKDPRVNLNFKGAMNADQDGGDAQLAFRLNKEALFLNLMSLNGKGQVEIPEDMKQEFVGKWWTYALPEGTLDQLAEAFPQGDEESMTPEQKQIKELMENTTFFKDVKLVGSEKVGNENSNHYAGTLDKVALSKFVTQVATIQGETITESDQSQLDEAMKTFDFTGDLYVSQSTGTLNRIAGKVTLLPNEEAGSPTGTVSIDLKITDLNKPVTVEVPAGAETLPLEELAGMMM